MIAAPLDTPAFPGLAAFARIETVRQLGEAKPSASLHYLALSKRLPPKPALEIKHAHWSVENSLHWPRDVVFHEDDARTRKDYAPQTSPSSDALPSTSCAPTDNRSLARKMNLAAWKKEFFYELFAHMR